MLAAGIWKQNQPNTILFVLVDSSGSEVTGLGSTFDLEISKAGAAFAVSLGAKSEIGSGWYKYVAAVSEADTPGPIAVKITGAGIVQQNLEYVVETRVETAIEFLYTLSSTATGNPPIEAADVLIYTDSGGINFVWGGKTDAFGIARDSYGELPRLEPGTYFFFRYKNSFSFNNPDVEIVSQT